VMVGSTAMASAERSIGIRRNITGLAIAPAYAYEGPKGLKHNREVRQDGDAASHRMIIMRLDATRQRGAGLGSKD
jgi:hypothetical protein